MTATAQKRKLSFSRLLGVLCVMVLGIVYFPMTALFCGCLLPAFVAALVDNKPDKTAGLTVGILNLAGTVPAGLALYDRGGRIGDALALLTTPQTLLLAYGAAAVGWVIYLHVPGLVSGMMAGRGEKRRVEIDRRQQELVRKWGSRIAGEAAALSQPPRQTEEPEEG